MTRKDKGFTLIEIIVILVVAGIMAAVMVPFMGTALTRSHEPLENLRRASGLSSDMARVVAEWDEIIVECHGDNEFLQCIINALEDFDLQKSNLDEAKLVMFQKNNNDDYSEADCSDSENDPAGCKVFAGPNCKELENGWECTEWAGQGAQQVCKAWSLSDVNCMIKVRLKGSLNPGEILIYYFPPG